jgi:hypothetical protein
MISKKATILILPVIFSLGCREEFMPKVEKYDNLLVVDGMITNEPGPYTIKLSRSSPAKKPDVHPFTGCDVQLHEKSSGNSEPFSEEAAGTYTSPAEGMQAQVGEAYKLTVVTSEGARYETDYITMKPPVAVDTVTTELLFRQTPDYPRPVAGYQFFVSSEEAPTSDYNFLWKLTETYEFNSEFRIHGIYQGQGIQPFADSDSLYTCWKTKKVAQIFTGSVQGLSPPQITRKSLHYVNTETKQLQVRYSLLVEQYSINRQAYTFWKDIRDQVESDDFLFASQPYQIKGNMYNADDPDEAVMGYFTVGSVSRKRIFVDRPDAEFFYPGCTASSDLIALAYMTPEQFPVYLTNTSGNFAYASDYCFDCTLWGGKLEKPEFWIVK